MVTTLEAALVVVVLAAIFGAYRVIRAVKPLIVNAVVGLVALLVAGALGFGVQITPVVVLIVALGGIPAAILVVILAHVGVVFEPALVLA